MPRHLLAAAVCAVAIAMPAAAETETKLAVALHWQEAGKAAASQTLATIPLADVDGKGLWVVFRQSGKTTRPCVILGGKFLPARVATDKMDWLEVVMTVRSGEASYTRRGVLFSKTRAGGVRKASPKNVCHVLVLSGFADAIEPPAAPDKDAAPAADWAAPMWRTHRIALNYAIQSDAKTREFKKAYGVKARYAQVRLVLAAEQWLDIPKEVREKKKRSSGGLFGGKLNEVADEIAGEKKTVPQDIPIYSLDVLQDDIEAAGTYPRGFQAARSLWNDLLEGKVLYEATGGKRHVLTAGIVFSQMLQNAAKRKTEKKVLSLTAGNHGVLDKCEGLWPAAKAHIRAYLKAHPKRRVNLPARPVAFYQDDKVAYATYAWYEVDPATGRMVGRLSDTTRGGHSDELERLQRQMARRGRGAAGDAAGGAVRGFFSTVAGMYVGAAGILDGVALTIADPSIAAMDGETWKKFMTEHALDFCQQFLENHAMLYDSAAAQLGFWQGALGIIAGLGGPDAVSGAADRALGGGNRNESFTNGINRVRNHYTGGS